MKKRINDNVVEIGNIDLFIRAMEDLQKPGLMANKTSVMLPEDNCGIINRIIMLYDKIHKKLPYPLYSMEIDLKYAVIGSLIKEALKEEYDGEIPVKMWVENGNGLYINPTEGTPITLHLRGKNYTCEEPKEEKEELNLLLYKENNAYKEFMWVYDRILTKKSTTEFYYEFFKELVAACADSKSLKRELGNILVFNQVPFEECFKNNVLYDVTRKKQYTLDIFTDKKIQLQENEYILDSSRGILKQSMEERIYDFAVYAKDNQDTADIGKMYRMDYEGLAGVFEKVIGEGTVSDSLSLINYKGVVIGNDVVFEINNKVYLCTLSTYTKPKCILRNASLYAVTDKGVYLKSTEGLISGVKQICIYFYNTARKQMTICKVSYERML